MENGKKYIVTGGGGFVGKALCLRLKGEGHEVIALGRREYPELEAAGVKTFQLDISSDRSLFAPIFHGADAVFHVAAKVDMWGRYEDFFRSNVLGARNIIACCKEQRVPKLIYTSSPSVIAGDSDLEGVNESYPYPRRHKAFYPMTKAMAEREVLAACESRDFFSISLRPHLIFGPGDQHFVPTILERARSGRMLQVGSGRNLVDFTFIEDCIEAHLCALRALDSNPACRGRAYFISQGEPFPMYGWINKVLALNGLPPVQRKVPKMAAKLVAWCCETASSILPGHPEPLLTRFLVSEMTTHHYFDISRAREDLGYKPSCSIEQALERTFARA